MTKAYETFKVQASENIVARSFDAGEQILSERSPSQRKQMGQFLTPVTVARYMARQLGQPKHGDRILDPAIGSGVLACAVIERAILAQQPMDLWIDGYEVDAGLAQVARQVLQEATHLAAQYGIVLHTNVHDRDFVLDQASPGPLFDVLKQTSLKYDYIIANPPYFKLNRNDPRVRAVIGHINGHTNIYTLFIALSLRALASGGHASFIVPRSFCSGAYFAAFRKDFVRLAIPTSAHLFGSRQSVFRHNQVLQENLILTFRHRQANERNIDSPFYVHVSASQSDGDLDKAPTPRKVSSSQFLGHRNGTVFFRLPTSELDEDIVETVDLWKGSLHKYGLGVSTGPVVAFRARPFLADERAVELDQAVPLLWMQNVQCQHICWPTTKGNKPQGLLKQAESNHLLVPLDNYVLIRRFSAKEERRRLVAAPLLADRYPQKHQHIGLENHLNFIYRKQGGLTVKETIGLSALLNSALIDRYFRIMNGNTQVNATELRALPLPPLEIIRELGHRLSEADENPDLDDIIFAALRETGYLSPDFPTIRETRTTMANIQQAQEALRDLGLPPAQQNEISALTLLVLAQLSDDTPWTKAQRKSLRIHDILLEIRERYGREYAENTRETIRRQVIHQFQQAGLVLRNPDAPGLPTNSPRTHYALSDSALGTVQAYNTNSWGRAVQEFIRSKGTLLALYQKGRDQHKVPLILADGQEYYLSPGKHNVLQAAIVQEFGPRFAPGATVLYLGDAENKTLVLDEQGFEAIGIPAPSHDKLPDVVLYDKAQNWVYLIEAVTSHGPMSPKRQVELEEMFEASSAKLVYVTAFPDFATFKGFLTEVAWETEVWLAEIPDHLIHFNGDRFLGPRS